MMKTRSLQNTSPQNTSPLYATRPSTKRLLPLASLLLTGLTLAALMVMAGPALAEAPAAKPGSAYWRDSQGLPIRDGSGGCVRAGFFSNDLATEECDPNLVKKAAPAPVPAAAPAPKAAPAPLAAGNKIPELQPAPQQVKLEADSLFDFDKSVVKPEGAKAIRAILERAKGTTIEQIRLEGYTDSVGTAAYNMALSKRRAEAVRRFLIKEGVDAKLIQMEWFGENRPIASNLTPEGRAQNRRVEVDLIASRVSGPAK